MIDFITNQEIYSNIIIEKVPQAKSFLWLATSDLKDLHVTQNRKFVPFLSVIAQLLEKGVAVRLIHAKEPGPAFRKDFDRFPILAEHLERLLCPRVHFKSVIIDGVYAYSGSANLTGAGMGAKSNGKRNFESGFISDEPWCVQKIQKQFDEVWMGMFCKDCVYISFCPDRDVMM